MRPSSTESNNEAFEEALCRLPSISMKGEAKEAAERLLIDAISKAEEHVSDTSKAPHRSLEWVLRELSELSGLCAWHGRKLTRLLSLVRADDCDIEMMQALEKPLADFFSGGFGNDFLVSVKDYTFYSAIKLEEGTEDGGVDSDLLCWAERNVGSYAGIISFATGYRVAATSSRKNESTASEALHVISYRLGLWIRDIRAIRASESKFQKTRRKIIHFFGNDKKPNVEDQNKMSLGASPEEFESLIKSMKSLIEKVAGRLSIYANVTARRHEHTLTILLDDIRLQANLIGGLGSAITRQSDSTPYQRAQALELRVQDWVRHEMEFCEFRDEIRRLLIERLLPGAKEAGLGEEC